MSIRVLTPCSLAHMHGTELLNRHWKADRPFDTLNASAYTAYSIISTRYESKWRTIQEHIKIGSHLNQSSTFFELELNCLWIVFVRGEKKASRPGEMLTWIRVGGRISDKQVNTQGYYSITAGLFYCDNDLAASFLSTVLRYRIFRREDLLTPRHTRIPWA